MAVSTPFLLWGWSIACRPVSARSVFNGSDLPAQQAGGVVAHGKPQVQQHDRHAAVVFHHDAIALFERGLVVAGGYPFVEVVDEG